MANLKQLRKSLALTQPDMAAYLGVTRTQLSMAELGRRNLPDTAELKILGIQRQLLNNASPGLATEMTRQSAADKNMLSAQVQRYKSLMARAERKLETLRIQYTCCLKLLQVTYGLLDELPNGNDGKKEKAWLEVMRNEALKKMKECNTGMQSLLELEVNIYKDYSKKAELLII